MTAPHPLRVSSRDARKLQGNVNGAEPTRAQPVKHLRIREENIIGGTRYVAICGASGITGRDYSKNAEPVNCPRCVEKLNRKARTK